MVHAGRSMFGYLSVLVALAAIANATVMRRKPTYHERLTKRELSEIFGTESQGEVPQYDIAKLTRNGNLPVSLKIAAFGTELRLNLTLDQDFIAKGHTIEFYGANGKVEKYAGTPGQYSTGTVYKEKGSNVALHHNDNGVSGAVRTKKDMFFINPLPRRMQTSEGDHILFRRTDIPHDHSMNHQGCGVGDSSSDMMEDLKRSFSENLQRRKRAATQPTKTLEVMIAADYKMVEHYTKLFLPTYMLAVANIMSGLYKDPSLEYPLDVLVTRTVIFETNQFKARNIYELLNNFAAWAKDNNPEDDNDPNHVDNALLMTRDGCDDKCGLEGYAFVSTMCTNGGQSVSKDRGLMTALTMAHELGHNLGVPHDGSEECPDGKNIMTTGTANGQTVFQWSPCSSRALAKSLNSAASTCLDDVPAVHKSNVSFQLYGKIFNADKQCEFVFGSGHRKCAHAQSSCAALYCEVVGASKCVALTYPAVHGTPCGDHKHCIQGQCVPDGTTPEETVDGQWGEWSDYTKCNRDCDIGVQWKTRNCDSPTPKNGGAKCLGETKGYFKTCNTLACEEETPTFRLQQCKDLNPENKDFYDNKRPCHLVCGSSTAAYYFGVVKDGTKCVPNGKDDDICVQGVCKKIGCDLGIESGNVIDRCGVCKGSGNTCELVTGEDYSAYATPGNYPLTVIPAGSTHIHMKEVGGTFNFLGFKVGDSSSFAIRLPTFSTSYVLDGVVISYLMEGYYYPDQLTANNKLSQKISTYLVNRYNVKSQGVTWSYYQPAKGSDRSIVSLKLYAGEWGPCSKSCGGGFKDRPLICKRQDDNSSVSIDLCNNVREKPATTSSCNTFDCPVQWHVTDWTTCTKSCGNGTQRRQLFCSKLDASGNLVAVDNTECSGGMPIVTVFRQCNAIICPAVWTYGTWSECSQVCGGGIRKRTATCKHIDEGGLLKSVNPLACQYLGSALVDETCNADVACPVWKVVYSDCSVTCGGGKQTASIVCQEPSTERELDATQCGAATKPGNAGDKVCNAQLCSPFIWKNSEGPCSVTCGTGLRPVIVSCYSQQTKETVEDSKCPSPKPNKPEPVTCDVGICVEDYKWVVGYSKCSVTCGSGSKTTIPYCQRLLDSKSVDNIYCDASTKPTVESLLCSLDTCPIRYTWKVEYADCSVTCGKGVMKPVYKCLQENDNTEKDSSLCDNTQKPLSEEKPCSLDECPATVSWVYRSSSCSVTCGKGIITSSPICRRETDNQEMLDTDCSQLSKPPTQSHQCSETSCVTPFYWKAKYGQCIAKCGPGYKAKFVDCIARDTGFVVPPENCKGMTTPKDEACETRPCTPVFESDKMPPSYAVGCYNDIPTPRRVPILLDNYRGMFAKNNSLAMIKRCAEQAHSMGYVYFSVQFQGECWAGDESTANSYYLNGYSDNCQDGSGGAASNFVYKIGSPEVIKAVPAISSLGCFEDDLKNPRPLGKYTDNFRPILDWKAGNYHEIINMCARSTERRSWKTFGLQYYGECWSGAGTLKTYNRAGRSSRCQNGVGGMNANFVYTFVEED